jgi:hypothetical protein
VGICFIDSAIDIAADLTPACRPMFALHSTIGTPLRLGRATVGLTASTLHRLAQTPRLGSSPLCASGTTIFMNRGEDPLARGRWC